MMMIRKRAVLIFSVIFFGALIFLIASNLQSSDHVHFVEPETVFVQGGTFMMGCANGLDCNSDEIPVHSVTVGSFNIGKYPVTQGQWKALMGSNPSRFSKGDNYPIEYISWNEAQEFIRRLNTVTGKRYRLPTEAEWEYAARGGEQSRVYKYSGSNNLNDVGWYNNNSKITHPVGAKMPNELGIYDMSGNIWEWCSDWYGSYYALSELVPVGASSGNYRVNRGGSWSSAASNCRVNSRSGNCPNNRYRNVGFRVALCKL